MASFSVIIQSSAEAELRQCPFPFRRQIVQAIYKLKNNPRPATAEAIESARYRLPVPGWVLVYEIEDDAATVTIFRVYR